MDEPIQPPWWRTRRGIVLAGFLAIAGFFLITEHTAHVLGALPYLLLASCLLMHVFMHHGHPPHNHNSADSEHPNAPDSKTTGEIP